MINFNREPWVQFNDTADPFEKFLYPISKIVGFSYTEYEFEFNLGGRSFTLFDCEDSVKSETMESVFEELVKLFEEVNDTNVVIDLNARAICIYENITGEKLGQEEING